jgi:hypothetical protein
MTILAEVERVTRPIFAGLLGVQGNRGVGWLRMSAMLSRARLGFPRLIAGACLVTSVLPTAAFAQYAGAKPVPKDFKKGFDNIKIEDARKWLGYLAGPECEGRGTGEPGFQKAAEYMAARFKEFGLKPVGDNGTYFQGVPFPRAKFDDEGSFIEDASGRKIPAKGNFGIGRPPADSDASGKVIILRAKGVDTLGEQAKELKGAIVIVVGGRPGFALRGEMREAGAAVVFSLVDAVQAPGWSRGGRGNANADITKAAASDLVSSMGLDKALLDPATMTEGKAELLVSSGNARLVMKSQRDEGKVPNVVGLLEGTDKTLKAEIIGIGAHLDHLGKNAQGVIYYGADDDGSGSTALLCVAKALTSNPVKPKRSILFMAFCGEEMGLVGSRYYTDHPIFPHEKMFCELQMDMVGRDSDGIQNGDAKRVEKASENYDTIRLVGSKRISQELDDLIQKQNTYVNFRFKYDAEDVYTRSDHYNFAKNGIPISFLFDGFHPDYHQPTDTIEKINFAKLTNSAKLYYLTILGMNDVARPLLRNGTDVAKKS